MPAAAVDMGIDKARENNRQRRIPDRFGRNGIAHDAGNLPHLCIATHRKFNGAAHETVGGEDVSAEVRHAGWLGRVGCIFLRYFC